MIDAECKVEEDPFGQERTLWDRLKVLGVASAALR